MRAPRARPSEAVDCGAPLSANFPLPLALLTNPLFPAAPATRLVRITTIGGTQHAPPRSLEMTEVVTQSPTPR